MAELALVRGLGGAAQLRGQRLHAVADPQHRHAGVEYFPGRARGTRPGPRPRPARPPAAPRREQGHFARLVVPRPTPPLPATFTDHIATASGRTIVSQYV